MTAKVSCVSVVRRTRRSIVRKEPHFLCVWNRRFRGLTLPGGKQEKGETDANTQERELFEETGCITKRAKFAYEALHTVQYEGAQTAFTVRVFVVDIDNEPGNGEPGCPVVWVAQPVLLVVSPFGDFYADMLKRLG